MPLPKAPTTKGTLLNSSRSVKRAPKQDKDAGKIQKPTAKSSKSTGKEKDSKLFVLDTNVLLHDPSSLFRFHEHDVFLPLMTLEELDNHKKGSSDVARNGRQVSRTLDRLLNDTTDTCMAEGIPLNKLGSGDATGKLYFQTTAVENDIKDLTSDKPDNQILAVVRSLQKQYPGRVVALVSKDINMRIKAKALKLAAEDYRTDLVLEDSDLLYTGMTELPSDFWTTHGKGIQSWNEQVDGYNFTLYRFTGPFVSSLTQNEFVYLDGKDVANPFYAKVLEIDGDTAVVRSLRDYTNPKHAVWGITAKNREQNFALNMLMDPECDFVTLLGQAGTGKTLLTLAAGLSQVMETKKYSEIIVTRVTVPVGEDIGFLPGTEEEKMNPWMGAFDDNLEVLNRPSKEGGEWGKNATNDFLKSKIKIKSLNFMRGRTFVNKFLIVDEAQNLTPKQAKTLITRAGPGTKILFLGNIAQIDTPYLTEGSSGLTHVVDSFKGWKHGGHITLARGERSRLADHASEVL